MSGQRPSVNKLAREMALKTAAVALLLATVISLYTINIRIENLRSEQQQIRSSLIAATLPAFNLATFNYNNRLNQHLADGLARHPQIASVVVLDSDGSIQARSTPSPSSCTPQSLDQLLFGEPAIEVEQLDYAGTHLGKLVVEDDPCSLADSFYHSVWQTIAYIVLITSAISIFIYASFFRRVTLPLTRLSRQIGHLTAENIEATDLSHFHSERRDELGNLITGTRRLLELLKDHIARSHKAEKTISEYSAKLETLIHKRSDALAGIHRKLNRGNDDENQGQVPLLALLLPQASELLSRIGGSLHSDDRDQVERFLLLLTRLSALEQIESAAVVCPNTLAHERSELCRSDLTLRMETTDSLIIAPERFTLLLDNLLCIAAQSPSPGQTLTLRRRSEQLEAVLTGEQFTVPFSGAINSAGHPFELTPATLSAICEALGGHMEVEKPESGPLRLVVQIPAQWLNDKLVSVREHLRHTPVRVALGNQILQHQIQRWLNEWDIPVSLTTEAIPGSVTLTDSVEEAHSHSNYFLLETSSPDQVYRQQDLLSNLQQMIPGSHSRVKTAQILLVDDNTINRMLCQRFLKNLGITPDAVDNGLQALEHAQRKHYDLILMDCQMPVMDGFEATRQIRRHSMNMKTPIIALTGLTGEHERQHCLTAGMNDFIGKPFTQDQIQATLIQWLDDFSLTPPSSAE